MKTLFVTGTDTGCGKTHVSVAMMLALKARGLKVAGYKPVAAGCEPVSQGLCNEDALALQQAASMPLAYAEVNPLALREPIAPHIAAEDEAREIDLQVLLQGAERLEKQADYVIVEGAGGFLVPLSRELSFADLVAQAQWPCVLVVGMRLGCLNHALLTAEAIARRSRCLAWVANVLPPEQPRLQENIESLRQRLPVPCLGVIQAADPQQAAEQIDVDLLLGLMQNP